MSSLSFSGLGRVLFIGVLAFASPIANAQLVPTNWSGTANWSSGPNWSNGVPAGTNVAQISTGSVTVSDARGVGGVTLSGATLGGAGPLTVGDLTHSGGSIALTTLALTGNSTWSGGDWNSPSPSTASNAAGATLAISSGNNHDFNFRTITNQGTVNWSGGGHLQSGNGGAIVNQAAFNDSNATNVQANNAHGGTAWTFTNASTGTYAKSGAGTSTFFVPFHNNAAVSITAGTLSLSGGGTTSSAATFSVAAGSALNFGGGTHSLSNGAALTGSGTISASSGTLSVPTGSATLSNLTVNGGTLGGAGAAAIAGLTQDSGGVSIGAMNLSGVSNWSGGNWNSTSPSTAANAAGATLAISSSNNHDFNFRTITNQGTINWADGHLQGGNGGGIVNQGTFTDSTAGGLQANNAHGGTAWAFTNAAAGNYHKSGVGTTTYFIPFHNHGAATVINGVLSLSGGGTSSGAFATAAGATTLFAANHTLNAGAALNGAGTYQVSNGTLTVSGATSPAVLVQTGGSIAGPGSIAAGRLTLSGGSVAPAGLTIGATGSSWTGGNMNGPGTTTIASGAVLDLSTGGDKDMDRRTLINQGTVNWSSGYIRGGNGSTFTNAVGGTFNDVMTGGYTVHSAFGGASLVFQNDGTYRRNAPGTSYYDVAFSNNGSVDVLQGDLHLRAGGTMGAGATMSVAAGTNVYFTNGYIVPSGAGLTGAGAFRLTNGTFDVGGTLSTSTFEQTGGTLAGTHTLSGAFHWNGGTWSAAAAGHTTTIASGSTLNLATGNDHDFNRRAIVNNGTANWSAGYIRAGNGATFTNNGLFLDTNPSSWTIHAAFGGTFGFVNNSTYRRNAANSTSYIDVPFTNNATVQVQAGDLQFRAGGSLASAATIDAAAGTNVYFTNGFSVANGSSLTGAGGFWFTGGTLEVAGTLSMPTFHQTGGTLEGTHTLTGAFNWSAGTWSTATANRTTTIAAGATLNLTTGSDKDFNLRSITNNGTVNWTAGYIRAGQGSAFTNHGTFNDTNPSGWTIHNAFGGTFSFVNNGTYRRNAAASTSYLDLPFTNNASVDVVAGDLQFRAGGSLAAAGTIAAAAGTNVTFTNGFTIANGSSLTGAGSYWLSGGTLDVAGTLAVSTFHQTGGVLEGINTLNGLVHWTGGTWSTGTAGQSTTIAPTATLNLNSGSDKDLNRRSVTNNGTVNWNAGYIRGGSGGVFTNNALFVDANPSGWTIHNAFGGTFSFVNNGTYRRDAGNTSYIDLPFDNNGIVDVRTGDLHFRAGGSLAATGTIAAAAGTNVHFTSGYTVHNGASLGGAGNYALTGGTFTVTGTLGVGTFSQTGGTLAGTHTLQGTYNWSSGDWSTGTAGPATTIAAGAVLNLLGGSDKDLRARAVTNAGQTTWNAGYIRSGQGGTFTNAAGGTFIDANASSYTVNNAFGGSFVFANHGTYNRNVGGITYFDTTFDNSGTIYLQQGEMRIRAGGTMAATSVVNASAATNFVFNADYTLLAGAELKGAGTFWHSGGNLAIDVLRASNFRWELGSWNSATPFTTTIAAGTHLQLVSGNNKDFAGRAIVNQGLVTWQAGYLRGWNGSTFTNASTGVFDDQNVSGYTVHNPASGTFTFTNDGLYTKGTNGTTVFDVAFTNNGFLSLVGGTLNFRSGFANNNGGIQLANGARLESAGPIAMGTAALAGTGTIAASAVTAGGVVAPGNSAGTLTITGNLTLLGTSTLLLELGGTTAGVTYDLLSVGGNVLLGGNLQVTFVNGFQGTVIQPTDTFTMLTGTSVTGAFANIASGQRLLTGDGFGSFQVNYGGSSLTLSSYVATIPEPSTYALLGLGAAVVLFTLRRRR